MSTTTARFELNGTAEPKGKGKGKGKSKVDTPKPKPPSVNIARFRLVMTIGLGVGIPLLSLAMSKVAGTLAANSMFVLAALAFCLMMSVLGVSLSHLAWAISHITRSGPRASWALAVALDLSLVLCELVHVYAHDLGLAWVCYSVMLFVAISSQALNCYAFLFHGGK